MGREIVYCFRCDLRLTGADIDQGKAIRLSEQVCCIKCLTPQEKAAVEKARGAATRTAARSPRRTQPRRQPAQVASRPEEHAPKRGNPAVLIGAIGGGVVVLLVVLVLALGGDPPHSAIINESDPSSGPIHEASAKGTFVERPPDPTQSKDRQAAHLLAQARGYAKFYPDKLDEQKKRFEKILWDYADTAASNEASRELAALEKRVMAGFMGDLESLRSEMNGAMGKHDFRRAQELLDGAKRRHSHPQWGLAIGKLDREILDGARSRLKELVEQASRAADRKAYDEIRKVREEIGHWGPSFQRLLVEFDSEFEATLADANAPAMTVVFTAPNPNARPEEGGEIAFTVAVTGPVSRVEYLKGNTVLADVTSAPFAFTWKGVPAGMQLVSARPYDRDGRPGPTTHRKVLVVKKPTFRLLVKRGSVWKYLDDGSDQGTAWTAPGFDDAAWKQGPAKLGYGDGDEKTLVSFGGKNRNKFITTYFRHAFQVDDTGGISTMVLRVLRDDGAVVYLNGKEVVRTGLPGGRIGHQTEAMDAGTQENTFIEFQVASSHLARGRNVLAVEVHQRSKTSSDMGFDLELQVGGVASAVAEAGLDIGVEADCEVLWKGTWYGCTILKKEGDSRWFIHYIGDDSSYDEWVGKDRIRLSDCEVHWEGTWYKALVLKKEGDSRWYIHYLGDDSTEDEWVEKDRIRFPK